MKIFKYFFEALIIYSLFILSKILGIALSRKIFSLIFIFFGPFFRSKKVINKNLNIFSCDLSIVEKNNIIKNMWSNYGKTFIEYIFLDDLRNKKNIVNIQGINILKDISENKSPVIFISGHFANFELMSMEITKNNIDLATIYRPLNNFFLNPFMEYLRKKYVCNNQIKKGRAGVKEAINYLNKRFSIALMIDQRVSEGEIINFFNKEALTTTLPAQIAFKYNLKIVPVSIERNKDDSFNMKVLSPIDPKKFKNKHEISNKLNELIEKMIKQNPNQWIWTHDRWKL